MSLYNLMPLALVPYILNRLASTVYDTVCDIGHFVPSQSFEISADVLKHCSVVVNLHDSENLAILESSHYPILDITNTLPEGAV